MRKPWTWKLSPHLRWFSVGQAARFVGLEDGAIKRMLREGRLHSTTVPGDARPLHRIPREELEAVKREMERGLAVSRQGT